MNISILCPTRARPEFLYELIYSALGTAADPKKLEFIFYTDNDDEKSNVFFENHLCFLEEDFEGKFDPDIQVKRINGNRIVLSEMWNKCWENSTANIFFHCGDDIRFRTPNWDQIVIEAFNKYPDKIAFLYGNDGYHHSGEIHERNFGTHGFLHRNWTDVVGCFVPPYFSSDFNDTWLNEVSEKISRRFSIPIYTEHLHPVLGKYKWDKTHMERIERHKKDQVNELYFSEKMKSIRQDWANKLQNFIDNNK